MPTLNISVFSEWTLVDSLGEVKQAVKLGKGKDIMGQMVDKSHKYCDLNPGHRNKDLASSHIFFLDVSCVHLYIWLVFFFHLLSPSYI